MTKISYRHLAQVYDRLMQDAPYDEWLNWTETLWEQIGVQPHTVVDLACGTGTLTWKLAKTGRTVVGIDRSAEMLAVAAGKRDQWVGSASNVQWLEQDMRELSLPNEVDAVVCYCDSLNYLLTEADWQRTFQAVYRALCPGGVFLFDIHSIHKISHGFGNELFAWEESGVYCVWHNHFDDTTCMVEQDLMFFVEQPDGRYERFDEQHQQRAFPLKTVKQWLEATGFTVHAITNDFHTDGAARDTAERLFFAVQKRVR